MENNKKIYVGQKIVLVIKRRRSDSEVKEVTVSKVGRKYFKLDGPYDRDDYHIDTLIENGNGNYLAQCYLTMQEYLDKIELGELSSSLRRYFSGYGDTKLTLDQMRKVADIIGIESEK